MAIFDPKRYKQTDEWKNLHNAKLRNLYKNASIINTLKSHKLWWVEHVARMKHGRTHKLLLGKPERKHPRGRLNIT